MSQGRLGNLSRREVAGDEHCGDRLGSRSVRAKSAQGRGHLVRQGRELGVGRWDVGALNAKLRRLVRMWSVIGGYSRLLNKGSDK